VRGEKNDLKKSGGKFAVAEDYCTKLKNCHNGQKGDIAGSIVRLLYETVFHTGRHLASSQPKYPTDLSLG